jgi:acylphosphatase
MKRLTVYFSGHVQGVGFRYTASQTAAGYEVVGTVENLEDGRVLLTAEGEEQELQEFLVGICESQLGSHIRQKEVAWAEPQGGFKGFKILRA